MNNPHIQKLVNYFMQGLLFTLPIAATIFVIFKAFLLVDSILPLRFPGLGLLIILGLITLFGYLSRFYLANPVSIFIERMIDKAPLAKIIYSSVKDLIGAFVGEKKSFQQPVLVTICHDPLLQKVGFITSKDLTHIGIEDGKVAVYLPYSYGFNGQLMIVELKNVTFIGAPSAEMMKFVISGGVTEIN